MGRLMGCVPVALDGVCPCWEWEEGWSGTGR